MSTKEEIRAELHTRLDQMVDHLEFLEGDQVTEIAELTLRANGLEEFISISRDTLEDGTIGFFPEVFMQYSTRYEWNAAARSKLLTEIDTLYYHCDGTPFNAEELEESGIFNGVRIWISKYDR